MHLLKSFVMFCLLILLTNLSLGSVIEHPITYKEYIVKPIEGQSLKQAINAASPLHEEGQTYHGFTKWYVSWHFDWDTHADNACKIIRTTTEVTSEITLPKLVTRDKALQEKFARYLAALRNHELGHVRNGANAAYAIDDLLSSLPSMSHCQTLSNYANDLANKKLTEYNALDKNYDATTQHGKTQGAVLDAQ